MADWVVDTNVWLMADKFIAEISTPDEIDCIEAALDWLRNFEDSDDHLWLDDRYKILGEYRRKIKKGHVAEARLNQLEQQPRERLREVRANFDEDGYAILPEGVSFHDPADRVFLAVALKRQPPVPIVNASDTDWRKERAALTQAGVSVEELCPAYIDARLKT